MGNHFMKAFIPAVLFALVTSCGSAKKIAYLEDVPDSARMVPASFQLPKFNAPLIQSGDILQITILTLNPEENNIISAAHTGAQAPPIVSAATAASMREITGFTVDEKGNIEIPLLGTIHVAGYSTSEIKTIIEQKSAVLYKKPVVIVKLANFSISVLGEVTRPSTYIIPNEKISILDAIGIAGDLTIYGKRENVILARDSAGQKNIVRLNLNSTSILQSPYYYLKQGDMVYVEPNKSKIQAADGNRNRNITIAASALTLLVVIFSRL